MSVQFQINLVKLETDIYPIIASFVEGAPEEKIQQVWGWGLIGANKPARFTFQMQ